MDSFVEVRRMDLAKWALRILTRSEFWKSQSPFPPIILYHFLNTRGVNKVSFPLVPELVNHIVRSDCVYVRDRILTSHDACTSGTYRDFTVASLQRLKMEALIPAPANCEVQSAIEFLNAQNIARFEIHHQLCQVSGPNLMRKQTVGRCCRQFTAGRQHEHDEQRSGRPYIIRMTLWSLCGNELWRIDASQFRNSAVISCRFPVPCCTNLTLIVPGPGRSAIRNPA